MFEAKQHNTLESIFSYLKAYVIVFIISNGVGFVLLLFNIEGATVVFVLASFFGVFSILLTIVYHSRLQRETMAKMLGKDFMEFCPCEFCTNKRKETK